MGRVDSVAVKYNFDTAYAQLSGVHRGVIRSNKRRPKRERRRERDGNIGNRLAAWKENLRRVVNHAKLDFHTAHKREKVRRGVQARRALAPVLGRLAAERRRGRRRGEGYEDENLRYRTT